MYAIFEDGSHQFRVREGDRIRVDRRDGKAGDELVFSNVLLITEPNGTPTIGTPAVAVPESSPRSSINSRRRRSSSRNSAGEECSPPQWPSPTLHHGPNHERRPTLTSRTSLVI